MASPIGGCFSGGEVRRPSLMLAFLSSKDGQSTLHLLAGLLQDGVQGAGAVSGEVQSNVEEVGGRELRIYLLAFGEGPLQLPLANLEACDLAVVANAYLPVAARAQELLGPCYLCELFGRYLLPVWEPAR
jgi:hypothetical protein